MPPATARTWINGGSTISKALIVSPQKCNRARVAAWQKTDKPNTNRPARKDRRQTQAATSTTKAEGRPSRSRAVRLATSTDRPSITGPAKCCAVREIPHVFSISSWIDATSRSRCWSPAAVNVMMTQVVRPSGPIRIPRKRWNASSGEMVRGRWSRPRPVRGRRRRGRTARFRFLGTTATGETQGSMRPTSVRRSYSPPNSPRRRRPGQTPGRMHRNRHAAETRMAPSPAANSHSTATSGRHQEDQGAARTR